MAAPVPKLILGLDFAADRVAVAEVRRKGGGKFELLRNALFPRTFESGASLREALKERGFKAKHAAIAPPAEGTLFRHMFLPATLNRNIRPLLWTVINHEAPAEAAFDWIDLGEPASTPGHRLLMVSIVRAVSQSKSEDLVRRAGLLPVLSTPRNIGFFHLARALDLTENGRTVLLVDRRDDRLDLALVRGSTLLYCRGQAGGRSMPTRPSAFGGAETIARQIDTALQHAREQLKEPDLTPAAIYISGTNSASMVEDLSERTGFSTSNLDPFTEFGSGEQDTAQALDAEECVGAIGIALAGLRRNLDPAISLTAGKPKKIALDRDLRYYRTAIMVAILASAGVVMGNIYARDVITRTALNIKDLIEQARGHEADLRAKSRGLAQASKELCLMAKSAGAPEPVSPILAEISRILPPSFRVEKFRMTPSNNRGLGMVFEQVLRVELSISVPSDTLESDNYDDIVAVAEGLRKSPILKSFKYRREYEPLSDDRGNQSSTLNRPRWKFVFQIERTP